jgi:Leu/Phe-tRNA-protein transferase
MLPLAMLAIATESKLRQTNTTFKGQLSSQFKLEELGQSDSIFTLSPNDVIKMNLRLLATIIKDYNFQLIDCKVQNSLF